MKTGLEVFVLDRQIRILVETIDREYQRIEKIKEDINVLEDILIKLSQERDEVNNNKTSDELKRVRALMDEIVVEKKTKKEE